MLPLLKIEPHALDLLVRPRIFVPGTMVRTEAIISYFIFHKFWLFSTQVRLMYERVPRNRPPLLQHLEDPVVGFISTTSWGFGLSSPVVWYYHHGVVLPWFDISSPDNWVVPCFDIITTLLTSSHCYLKVTKLNSKCADGQNLVNIKMHQNH